MEGHAADGIAKQAAMFRVLADCSEEHTAFADRLLEALERHLGFRHSVCFYGSTAREALDAPAALRGRTRAMMRPYHERYAEHDIFKTPQAERRFQQTGCAALWDFTEDELADCRSYVEGFLGRFGTPWVFGMKIEAAESVPLFVSVLSFEGAVPRAEMSLLSTLRRPLGSLLAASDRRMRSCAADPFTPREREIANLVKRGYSNGTIARVLGIRVDTVKKHLTSMFISSGVTSRTQLAIALHARSGES